MVNNKIKKYSIRKQIVNIGYKDIQKTDRLSMASNQMKEIKISVTAWKVSVFGVSLVRIFPNLEWIWRDTPYLSVFDLNTGNSGPKNSEYGQFSDSAFSSLTHVRKYHTLDNWFAVQVSWLVWFLYACTIGLVWIKNDIIVINET